MRKLVIRPTPEEQQYRALSGIPREAVSLALSSGIVFCLVGHRFYSGLLWGDDVTGEPDGGAAYICAGRRDCKPGLLEVGISFVLLWLFVKVQGA